MHVLRTNLTTYCQKFGSLAKLQNNFSRVDLFTSDSCIHDDDAIHTQHLVMLDFAGKCSNKGLKKTPAGFNISTEVHNHTCLFVCFQENLAGYL